jgi:hypothetical protein
MIPSSWKRTIVALIIGSLFLTLAPLRARACGPFFTDAIFVFEKHPEFPLERFAQGHLGVLQPTYARSYLVAAYRNLIGEKLSGAEAIDLKGLWDDRINLSWDYPSDDWIKKWRDARTKVQGVSPPPDIEVYRSREKPHEYESYLNCQQDAFENAITTLNERITRFGADSAALRDWVAAQDLVFRNCGREQFIPDAAAPDLDPAFRADRAYQIAAAHFYSTDFDDAAREFDAIARDSSSPWRTIAPYLAARALLRKGSLAEKEEEGKPALAEAEKRLDAIMHDKALTRSPHAAGRLLNLTRLRLRPEDTVRELAQKITKKDAVDDFKQAVWDYTALLDKFVGEEEVKSESAPASIKSDDLTDWILTFQDQTEVATTHALEQWQKRKSLPWLVAAIAKATGNSPNANELIEAGAGVNHASPAFASVVFHRARLLTETNRGDEARTLLDRTLASETKDWPRSSVNLLLNERMMLAQNLDEFLKAVQREPAGFSDNGDEREIPMEEKDVAEMTHGARLFFDTDGAKVFNAAMPVAIIGDAAGNRLLPANLRNDVTQATFMRAALLDRAATANEAATKLANLYPQLREFLTAYQRAATPGARRFAAAYVALKSPGLRPFVTAGMGRSTDIGEIDSYRDNWWCAEPPGMFGGVPDTADPNSKAGRIAPPQFLKRSQTEAAKEVAALQAMGPGPNYLARTVIEWGTKNPADPRVPEALHLAVKSTRYGCTDKETGRWSKAAFDLLHGKYPNTTWAKETKYWFNG